MADRDPSSTPPQPSAERALGGAPERRLERLDAWMALHPWHPRLVPFAVYGALLLPVSLLREHWPPGYPVLYLLQCVLVAWLLWRYRRLLPEVTLSFHWAAVPVGILVFFAWVWLGLLTSQTERVVGREGLGVFTRNLAQWMVDPASGPGYRGEGRNLLDLGAVAGWTTMGLRLLGMALLVPVFEELFVRSLVLRSMGNLRRTAIGAVQILHDLPLVGDWLMHTDLAERAHRHPPVFGPEFTATPLGRLTWFGVLTSTVIFCVSHVPRDWPGAVFCAGAYCLLLAATARKGLGPVIWAHGITNALLWVYTIRTGDWQFL